MKQPCRICGRPTEHEIALDAVGKPEPTPGCLCPACEDEREFLMDAAIDELFAHQNKFIKLQNRQ